MPLLKAVAHDKLFAFCQLLISKFAVALLEAVTGPLSSH